MQQSSTRWANVLAVDSTATPFDATQDDRPTQFCLGADGRSPTQNATERACFTTEPSRIVVSMGRQHLTWRSQIDAPSGVQLNVQSGNGGTGAAALAAAVMIARTCPTATIVVMPTEQRGALEVALHGHVDAAMGWVERHGDAVVLFGAPATAADPGHGWLLPRARSRALRRPTPASLFDNPLPAVTSVLFAAGALWNTMVAVYSARTLINLAAALVPEWWRVVAERPESEADAVDERASWLPPIDLFGDVLARARGHLHVMAS